MCSGLPAGLPAGAAAPAAADGELLEVRPGEGGSTERVGGRGIAVACHSRHPLHAAQLRCCCFRMLQNRLRTQHKPARQVQITWFSVFWLQCTARLHLSGAAAPGGTSCKRHCVAELLATAPAHSMLFRNPAWHCHDCVHPPTLCQHVAHLGACAAMLPPAALRAAGCLPLAARSLPSICATPQRPPRPPNAVNRT